MYACTHAQQIGQQCRSTISHSLRLQQAKELLRVRNYVNNVLAHATGQPVEKIQHDFNRNK